MKKGLKMFLGLLISLVGLVFSYSNADSTGMRINLTTGWNAVSTPALLSSVSFSNGGDGISFFKMENGYWTSVIPNLNIFKPLEGFLVQNSTDDDVEMVLNYKETTDPTELIFQKSLSSGWNLVGITTDVNPLNHIAGAFSMALNLTNDGWNDYVNHIGARFNINTNNPTALYSPEFGEAYGVFVTSNDAVYGGVNTKRRYCTAFERVRCHLYHSEDGDIVNYTGFYDCLSSCTYANYENEPEIGIYVNNTQNNSANNTIQFDNHDVILVQLTLFNGTDHILRSMELSGFINPLDGNSIDVNDIIVKVEGRRLTQDEYSISESGILTVHDVEINVYGSPRVRIMANNVFCSQVLSELGSYEYNIELTKVNGQNMRDFYYWPITFRTNVIPAVNTYSDELIEGYAYAYANGLTTVPNIDDADLYGFVYNIELADIMSKYAMNVLGLLPNDSLSGCELPIDLSTGLNNLYNSGYTKLCNMGIILESGDFYPFVAGTQAVFGTWLSRALNDGNPELLNQLNSMIPYYSGHLNRLKDQGIVAQINNPEQSVLRGYVFVMLMRADENYTPNNGGCTIEELLECVVADDSESCIAMCNEPNYELCTNEELLVCGQHNNPGACVATLCNGSNNEGCTLDELLICAQSNDSEACIATCNTPNNGGCTTEELLECVVADDSEACLAMCQNNP